MPEARKIEDFVTHDLNGFSKFLNSIVVPRPIAFVTSKSLNGIINAAPFSYFNIVCTTPPTVSISVQRRQGQRKDTSQNIISTKEFVINICSVDIAKAVGIASGDFPHDVSEIDLADLSLISSQKISVPRIANTLAQMECLFSQVIEVGSDKVDLIIGEVLAIHLHKDILNSNGEVSFEKLNPLARLSGPTYARINDFFEIPREM